MNGAANGSSWGVIVGVLTALAMFGYWFNRFVGWAQRKGYDEGATAFEVVIGVLVTVAGASLLIWGRPFNTDSLALLLVCFIASGGPMIFGAWGRYALLREKGQAADRDRF